VIGTAIVARAAAMATAIRAKKIGR
jgi:hypothetical protein